MAEEITRLPLIGDKAPSFKAETTQGPIQFPEDFKGKWIILFSTRRTSPPSAPPSS